MKLLTTTALPITESGPNNCISAAVMTNVAVPLFSALIFPKSPA